MEEAFFFQLGLKSVNQTFQNHGSLSAARNAGHHRKAAFWKGDGKRMNRVDAVGFHGDGAEGEEIVGRGEMCHGASIAQKGRIGE